MTTIKRPQSHFFLALFLTIFVILLDRLTKQFFMHTLAPGESFIVMPNVLYMTLVYNTGFAFGVLKNSGIAFIVIPVIALILLIFNVYYFRKNDEVLSRWYVIGFSLILAGAIGNLYDRIFYGYVIDFIDFRIFPVFNVADSAITIGAVVIAFKCFQLSTPHKKNSV